MEALSNIALDDMSAAAISTESLRPRALKAKYLNCLRARSPLTLRQVVKDLIRKGTNRDLLITWAVADGHNRKYIGKLLSECLTALGIRQRQPGAGRRTAPPALFLFAFARSLFGNRHRQYLRAAWRAASRPASAETEVKGLEIIPAPELYRSDLERFSKRLLKLRKLEKPKANGTVNHRSPKKGTVR